jgi:hypothetical protein
MASDKEQNERVDDHHAPSAVVRSRSILYGKLAVLFSLLTLYEASATFQGANRPPFSIFSGQVLISRVARHPI